MGSIKNLPVWQLLIGAIGLIFATAVSSMAFISQQVEKGIAPYVEEIKNNTIGRTTARIETAVLSERLKSIDKNIDLIRQELERR